MDGSHDEMGRFTTTLNEYLFGPYQHAIIKGNSSSGAFSVDSVQPLDKFPPRLIAPAYRVGISGSRIKPMDINGKADPFFEVLCKPCIGYEYYDLVRSCIVTDEDTLKTLPLLPPYTNKIVQHPTQQLLSAVDVLQPPIQNTRYVLVPQFSKKKKKKKKNFRLLLVL
eukprot:TRINITY_DN4172_c0_g1_i1.p1 TRINITY_DN4172_c0_g1~~TRINITY_DN4172_c0_g1_i1.p1  ORF type:complete len:174 (-),score=30.10 TRINITY_DN4172_c0_g1_i1:49-549(-)